MLDHDPGLKLKTDNAGIRGCGICNAVCCTRFQKYSEMEVAAGGQASLHLIQVLH